jgi:hypothetical protein
MKMHMIRTFFAVGLVGGVSNAPQSNRASTVGATVSAILKRVQRAISAVGHEEKNSSEQTLSATLMTGSW